jgi:uncharacterized protein (DUF1778 family)
MAPGLLDVVELAELRFKDLVAYVCTDIGGVMSTATARIEVRVSPEVKSRIESAAALDDTSVSNFVIAAATVRADEVMSQHERHTSVPAGFFDDLIASLDQPAEVNPALAKAARRSHTRAAQF